MCKGSIWEHRRRAWMFVDSQGNGSDSRRRISISLGQARMIRPLMLILLAAAAACTVAYGTNPELMRYPHGLQLIMTARRAQGPMMALSLCSCLALIVM